MAVMALAALQLASNGISWPQRIMCAASSMAAATGGENAGNGSSLAGGGVA